MYNPKGKKRCRGCGATINRFAFIYSHCGTIQRPWYGKENKDKATKNC